MKLIAAVDKNWAIGNKGQLLVSIPQDQKMFRDETMGKVIVMGRKTQAVSQICAGVCVFHINRLLCTGNDNRLW